MKATFLEFVLRHSHWFYWGLCMALLLFCIGLTASSLRNHRQPKSNSRWL